MEFHKTEGTYELAKDETIKNDLMVTCARGRIDGTVEGDLYFFGQSVEVSGRIKGDLILFAQSARVSGQVDGNIRAVTNNLTITGVVDKNVLAFNEVLNLDSAGKVGGSLTAMGESVGIDGHLGRDLLVFDDQTTISGTVDGGIRAKGNNMSIVSSAQIAGQIRYEGQNPATVATAAKLASPVDYTKRVRKSEYTEGHYYLWRVIWTAAFVLFGLVLILLLPNFSEETVRAGERFGAPVGLGVLVFFAVPIAAIIACITVVGIPLGVLTIALWILGLFTAEIVVGAVVGNWILGRAADTWGLIGRMAMGFALVRIVYTPLEHLHVIGFLVALGILMWGMGAISLALYNRFSPTVSSSVAGSAPPVSLPPYTTVGGIQPA
jgi:cytoskeletal protein CcmA (bactofilin family)